MTEFIQVTTTTESKANAQAIARAVVEQRLAACAQIAGPIESTYWWQGQIESAQEWLCVFKSRRELCEKLEQEILGAHPYETPEILVTPIAGGSEPYLAWLRAETMESGDVSRETSH